jgi:hypothetical protein
MIHRIMPVALLLCLASAALAAESTPHFKRLSDVLDVDVRDRKLHIVVRPPTDFAGGAITVGSAEDQWDLTVGDRNVVTTPFELDSGEREADRWSSLHLVSVTRDANQLRIYGVGRARNTFVGVTLEQDAQGVSFLVQRVRRARNRPLEDATAADLAQLWHEHQPQLREYLLPLLDEISQSHVLRPRGGDVYRAFADIPADPLVLEKLRELLPRLDADDARQRAAASAELAKLGASAVLAALRIDSSELAPEQRARLDTLIDRNTIWPDPAAARKDPRFLIDCLDNEDPDVRSAARSALVKLTGKEIEFDPSAPLVDRREAAGELLEALQQREAQPAASGE